MLIRLVHAASHRPEGQPRSSVIARTWYVRLGSCPEVLLGQVPSVEIDRSTYKTRFAETVTTLVMYKISSSSLTPYSRPMDRSHNVSGFSKLLAGGVAGAAETFVTVS